MIFSKHTHIRKGIADVLLCIILVFEFLPKTDIEGNVVFARQTQQEIYDINIGTGMLCDIYEEWDAVDGITVYYGNFDGNPVAYRVLAASPETQTVKTECVLLDADAVLRQLPFHASLEAGSGQASGNANEWAGSDLQAYMGRRYEDGMNGADGAMFSQVEAGAIAQTTLTGDGGAYNTGFATLMDYASTDYLFLLSAREAKSLYYDNAARKKAGGNDFWWLRSAGAGADASAVFLYDDGEICQYNNSIRAVQDAFAGFVFSNGEIYNANINTGEIGISPAFNLNLSSVLFTSSATDGNGFAGKSSILADGAVNFSTSKEWKLTLKDSSKTIKITDDECVIMEADGTVIVPYTYTDGSSQNLVNQVSVMVTDRAYTEDDARILYYGALQDIRDENGESLAVGEAGIGIGTFMLPENLPQGYKIYILAECVSEGNYSDYASEPVQVLGHDFSITQYDENGHWKVCSHCGGTQEKEEHVFDDDNDTNCNGCEYVRTVEQEHTHSGTLVEAKAAACTEDGHGEYYICVCGKWFSDNGCTTEITDKSSVVIDALGHDFDGEDYLFNETQHWRKCSQCSQTEQKENHIIDDAANQCTMCGYSKVVEPGHTHNGELVEATEPTCTLSGNKAYYTCSCGKWFSDSGCTVEIAESDIEMAALGHDFSVTNHNQREHWKKCFRCNEEQSRENHVYDNDSDCNVCGYEKEITEHTHSVAETVSVKEATCTTAGNSTYYICICGKWFSDIACTKEVTDQDVTIAAKGHDFSGDYQRDAKGHWKVCSRCGVKDTAHKHRYDNDRDAYCNDCNYKRTINNPGTDNKDDPDDEQTIPQPTPQPTPDPTEKPQQQSPTNPPETSQPTETPGDKPGTVSSTPDNRQPENNKESEATRLTEQPAGTEKEQMPEKDGEQTIPVSIDNGKIIVSGGTVETGNITDTSETTTRLVVGDGAIVITVVCEDEGYAAEVKDTIAVVNAVLTPEQIQLVNNGEIIEVRIDVKDISETVTEHDKEVIERGLTEIPELTLGMYVDISIFIRIGEGGWDAITSTKEPIEVIIGIPDELQEDSREFYIIRSHEGQYTLLNDMDNEPDIITISTDMFSAYAIAYRQTNTDNAQSENTKCGLCHICPTFLGICYFIWLTVIAVVIIVVIFIWRRKKGEDKKQETE